MVTWEQTDSTAGPLSWREAGDGPPIVFLHGLGGTRSAWGAQFRGLADQFRCIAWDMPGYGNAAPLTPLTYEGIADQLVMLLDHLELQQADLVGLSFGGMHAIHTALRHPGRVGRMVLADTSPAFGMDGTTPDEWRRSRLDPIDRGATPGDAAETVIDAITAQPLTGQIREETAASFGDIPVDGFRAAVACLPTNDVRDRLHLIHHEVLVIVGELDLETPVAYAQVLADGLPRATLEILNGVGHLTPAEDPTRFNELVAAFLTSSQND